MPSFLLWSELEMLNWWLIIVNAIFFFLHSADGVMLALVQTGSSGGKGLEVKLICTQQCRLASVDGTVSFLKFKGAVKEVQKSQTWGALRCLWSN